MLKHGEKLSDVDPVLADIVREVAYHFDVIVLCGHRGQSDQDKAVRAGNSKTPWPKSKHNSMPSKAVDIAPLPLDWADRERFCLLAGWVMATARARGVKLRWGGDWDNNNVIRDERLQDLVHFEVTA